MMLANTQGMTDGRSGFAERAYWIAAVAAATVVALVAVLYFSGWRYADVPATTPSFRAGCIGRFLLAAAAIAYLFRWHTLRQTFEAAGSGLAAVAVTVLLLSVVLRHFESDGTGLSVNIYGGAIYDPLVGFLTLAITAYLVMEGLYRDRSAGIWVIPVAAVASTVIELELLRMSSADSLVVLRSYWHSTTVLLSVVGYALLGAGCVLALISLVRHLRDLWFGGVSGLLPSLSAGALEAWMVRTNLCGFLLLVVAALVWEAWAADMPRAAWFVSPIEPWVLATALLYGGHFYLLRRLRPALAQTAFWVVGIYCTSLIAFLGINAGVA